MSVAVLISSESEALPLMHWAAHIAVGWGKGVFAWQVEAAKGAPQVRPLEPGVGEVGVAASLLDAADTVRGRWGDRRPTITTSALRASDPLAQLHDELQAARAEILLVGTGTDDALAQDLYRRLHCAVVRVRPGDEAGATSCERVLVPTVDSPHAVMALTVAAAAVTGSEGWVDAVFIEPPVGRDAELVGRRILERVVTRVDPPLRGRIRKRVLVAEDVQQAIASAVTTDYDLFLVGSDFEPTVKRMLFRTVSDDLMVGAEGVAVGVVRQEMPVSARFLRIFEGVMRRRIPQLGRQERVSLVEQIQSNSQWDVDFIALICLSTLIAALGLLQNSAAVVIGAMLLAPLMTPLIGGGIALVQGNASLLKASARSVGFGFLLAFAIGFLTGLLIPGSEATAELTARGSPNLLDLFVALVSGVAAAYATGRPNLSAALPGVAIAAALVPPIATSGIALAHGDLSMSTGAAVLFFTNIVAIVLGAAGTLYGLGIRGGHAHGRMGGWVRRVFVGLLIVAAVLSIPLGYGLYESRFGDRAPTAVREHVEAVLAKEVDLRMETISRTGGPLSAVWIVKVDVSGPVPPRPGLAQELSTQLSATMDRPITVELSARLLQRASPP